MCLELGLSTLPTAGLGRQEEGKEGQAGKGRGRQEQGTADWEEQSYGLPYSRESFWGWELMHITLCVLEEVREVVSAGKKLANPSLQNLTFLRVLHESEPFYS